MYLFISLLYMFRATQCSSSGESNYDNTSFGIYHSVQVTAWYAGPSGPAYQAVIYTEWYMPDYVLIQFDSPDDEQSDTCQMMYWYNSILLMMSRVIHTRWFTDTIDSPDDEHWIARNMQRSEINKYIEKSASSWLLTRIIPRCTVNEI